MDIQKSTNGCFKGSHCEEANADEAIPRYPGDCFTSFAMTSVLPMKFFLFILFLTAFLFVNALSASAQELKIEMREGGSVATNLEFGSALNNTSSLKRKLITINDPSSPARLSDTGIKTRHRDEAFYFEPVGWVNPARPVSAVNVRFILYDMFGNHIETLSGTVVEDFGPETSFDLSRLGFWKAEEMAARNLLTIVTFVAHVRTQGETVWTHSPEAIISRLNGLRLKTRREMLEAPE